MKKGIIFAGGEFSAPADLNNIIIESCIIVCADGGYDSAAGLGVVPDVIIGDMDSVKTDLPTSVKQIKLNCEKDDTDTQACIDYLIEEGCGEIVLLGALGGRADHELANIMLTAYSHKKGVKLILKNKDSEIFAVTDYAEICGEKGDNISLIPILGDAEGVNISGLKYTLENAILEAGKTVGISNEFIGEKAIVTVKKGLLIAIKTKR